jgi:hypothetical protein
VFSSYQFYVLIEKENLGLGILVPLCPTGAVEFDHLWCKNFELHNFELLHHFNAHHVRYLCTKS